MQSRDHSSSTSENDPSSSSVIAKNPLERIVFIQKVLTFAVPSIQSCTRFANATSHFKETFSDYGTPIFENLIQLEAKKLRMCETKSWQTCLAVACENGIEWIVDQLLPAAATFTTSTMLKETSIGFVSCAVKGNRLNIVKMLLHYGACVESDNHTKLSTAPREFFKLRQNKYTVWDSDDEEHHDERVLDEFDFETEEGFGYQFRPPIAVAFNTGNVDIVKLLLQHGATLDTVMACNGYAPLPMICCNKGHVEILKWLHTTFNNNEVSFDVNSIGRRNSIPPLFVLALNSVGDPEKRLIKDQSRALACAKYLIEECSANPAFIDQDTMCTVLHVCCGAIQNDTRWTSMYDKDAIEYTSAAGTCNLELLKYLIEVCGMNPNGEDDDDAQDRVYYDRVGATLQPQKSPLEFAVINLDVETVKYLLSLDAVKVGPRSKKSGSIHAIASAFFAKKISSELAGSEKKKTLDQTIGENLTRAGYAAVGNPRQANCAQPCFDDEELISRARTIINLLTSERTECTTEEAKKDFTTVEDTIDDNWVRPLVSCIRSGSILMMKLLVLEFDADWEAETVRGFDAIGEAAAVADDEVLNSLAEFIGEKQRMRKREERR